MKHKRYGAFKFKDLLIIWIGPAILGCMGIRSFFLGFANGMDWMMVLYGVIFLGVALGSFSIYALQYREWFSIERDILTFYNGRAVEQKLIPNTLLVVISPADMTSLLSKKLEAIHRDRFPLKGRFAITLLQNCTTEEALTVLHDPKRYTWPRMCTKYTSCYIEEDFIRLNREQFIYSFVGSDELLHIICKERDCTVIVPESLADKIPLEELAVSLIIDQGY